MEPPVCPHCRQPFRPEVHNAWHQRYCSAKECQRARNRESCRRWRLKNPGHYRDDAERTRDWRLLHPCYWRRERRKAFTVEILLPVHSAGRNTVGLRFRDVGGTTLRHVVVADRDDWLVVWRDVGFTLQNVVHGAGPLRLSLAS
jgi:hypothetical protein